jgi:hypothetical protein
MIDDRQLIAWLDGELGPKEARAVAAAVSADPELAARAEAHRKLAARLRSAFASVVDEALPLALTDALGASALDVVSLDRERALASRRSSPLRAISLPAWARLAAIAPLAFAAGYILRPAEPDRLMSERGGELVATGVLAHALDTQLASSPPPSSGQVEAIRVLLSFRARDGHVCRSWSTDSQAGIACHAGQGWTMAATASTPRGAGQYQMASGVNPGLLAVIDAMVANGPFDAAEEARLQKDRWR